MSRDPKQLEASLPELETSLRGLVAEKLERRVARVEWLPAQLGLRRFARLVLDSDAEPRTLVARIETPEDAAGRPTGVAPEPPLEPIRALLEQEGLPVPRRYAADEAAGIDLLEDAGDLCLRDAVSNRLLRSELYAEACDLIPRLQRVAPADVAAFERRLDGPLFAYKADLFARHALASRGREASTAERDVVMQAFADIATECADAPARLAHRDYQSANLHVTLDAAPGARLRLIDLQGAFLAPPEYDAVCLLRDSYVELDDTELAVLIERVRNALPDTPNASEFATRFDLLTLTRKGKDLARFTYAAAERGDRRFLEYVPATLRALRPAAERSAKRDRRFAALAELVHELPETPCEQ